MQAIGLDRLHDLWNERFGAAVPEKIVCVGLNYHDHAAEQGVELPAEPLLFAKLANALCGPGDPIVLPRQSGHVDAEAELAVVIGAEGRHVGADDALELVAGYTVANDVSARDLQFRDGQWLRAKSFDTFCPVEPTVVPVSELGEADGLRIVQRLNGEPLQDSTTAGLIFGVRAIVAHVSTVFTMRPGDLILTGTPAGVGIFRDPPVPLAPGDEVEIEIEGIGTLRSPVVMDAAE
ncbi:MAG TPA: fumarylacetoacetate hydrolase family protein [Gaiellaceae bacterium]|jgi:2-keto-4-pentenoate hydratase/2-oxohepta-3-ene-1,7-dioic acid hydratase in catechol pathway